MSRKYDSSRRAARADASRRQILDAARALFARRGIDGVTVAEIAGKAEVGASSVYAAFQSKGGILRALMEDAFFGPRYREARARLEGVTDVVEKVVRTAEVACAIYRADDEVLGVVRGASAFSPELRRVEGAFESMRYRMQGDRVRALEASGRLAPGLSIDDARRILWALTNRELYRSLVVVAGWSPARYERWLADTIRSQLVAPVRRTANTLRLR